MENNPVSAKQLMEAEDQATADIERWIKEARSPSEVLARVKEEISTIEEELGKRTIPYGAGFVVGKRKLPQYYPGVPAKILDTKWKAYKHFAQKLEAELVKPKTRRETVVEYDRGNTLAQLQALCRQRGLPLSGSKKELIGRLI